MQTTSEPRRRQKDPIRNRRKIVETTIKLLKRSGFHELSTQTIADTCGLSQSALFHHFKNKKALLAAVAENISTKAAEDYANPEDDAKTRLRKFFISSMEWVEKSPEQARVIISLTYEATYDKEFAKIYSERLEFAQRHIASILYAGIREGQCEIDGSVEDAAEILHSALSHGVSSMLASRKKFDMDEQMRKWDFLISLFLV